MVEATFSIITPNPRNIKEPMEWLQQRTQSPLNPVFVQFSADMDWACAKHTYETYHA